MSFLDNLAKALTAGAVARVVPPPDDMDIRPVEGVRTLFDEAQSRWPSASPEAIDELMWLTPYPAGSRASIVASLDQMRERWGPNIADAITGEHAEFDRIWEETRHERTANP